MRVGRTESSRGRLRSGAGTADNADCPGPSSGTQSTCAMKRIASVPPACSAPLFSGHHVQLPPRLHAGNHADVLKHTVLIATLDYLLEKDAAPTVVDTHAGAGLYRLDGDYAGTSGEAVDGILRLVDHERGGLRLTKAAPPAAKTRKKDAFEGGRLPR